MRIGEGKAADVVREKIDEAIAKKLDVESLCFSGQIFCIADFGRSTGPNTFIAMQNTVESVKKSRLSKVPEELLDKNSPSFNKGSIHYTNAPDKVVNAYASQFAKDIGNFLDARAKELVAGRMFVMMMPANPTGIPPHQKRLGLCFQRFESCFLDMIKEGIICEAQVDSFNLPMYAPSLSEMIEIVQRNNSFNVEKMELTALGTEGMLFENRVQILKMHMRAGLEEMVSKHFGTEIIDELFYRYAKKIDDFSCHLQSSTGKGVQLFVVLKRK